MAFYFVLIAIATAWSATSALILLRLLQKKSINTKRTGISVLKPLCGADAQLESNLQTFFEQTHPQFELLFGVQNKNDPAIEIVKRVQEKYPNVASKLIVHHAGDRALNPKVQNLLGMWQHAQHDVVLISDSNIAVGPDHLDRMQADLKEPEVGLVFDLFAGTNEHSLGARIENLHINGAIASGILLPTMLLKHPTVVGKSVLFRASTFKRLGGLESLSHVLAEDYVLGRMFQTAGYKIVLCHQPVQNISSHLNIKGFFQRHLRWSMMRTRLQPVVYLFEPFLTPTVIAALSPLFGVHAFWPFIWAIALTIFRDATHWTLLRGFKGYLKAMPLFLLRDVLIIAAWALAPFRKHITWRGHRVRLSAGTRLYAERTLMQTPPLDAQPYV